MTIEITSLRLEYGSTTPFVGVEHPRISWKTATDAPDWEQASAELSWTIDGTETLATVPGRGVRLRRVAVRRARAPAAAGCCACGAPGPTAPSARGATRCR